MALLTHLLIHTHMDAILPTHTSTYFPKLPSYHVWDSREPAIFLKVRVHERDTHSKGTQKIAIYGDSIRTEV
jgi:hypothetical protein